VQSSRASTKEKSPVKKKKGENTPTFSEGEKKKGMRHALNKSHLSDYPKRKREGKAPLCTCRKKARPHRSVSREEKKKKEGRKSQKASMTSYPFMRETRQKRENFERGGKNSACGIPGGRRTEKRSDLAKREKKRGGKTTAGSMPLFTTLLRKGGGGRRRPLRAEKKEGRRSPSRGGEKAEKKYESICSSPSSIVRREVLAEQKNRPSPLSVRETNERTGTKPWELRPLTPLHMIAHVREGGFLSVTREDGCAPPKGKGERGKSE